MISLLWCGDGVCVETLSESIQRTQLDDTPSVLVRLVFCCSFHTSKSNDVKILVYFSNHMINCFLFIRFLLRLWVWHVSHVMMIFSCYQNAHHLLSYSELYWIIHTKVPNILWSWWHTASVYESWRMNKNTHSHSHTYTRKAHKSCTNNSPPYWMIQWKSNLGSVLWLMATGNKTLFLVKVIKCRWNIMAHCISKHIA